MSATAMGVVEGETGTYTVKLNSNPGGSVTISAVSANPAAVRASPTVLTFDASDWMDEKTVTVTAVENADTAANVVVAVNHTLVSAPEGNGYVVGTTTIAAVSVTAVDDETAQVVVTPAALSIEQGAQGTVQVRLTQAPGASETVTISSVGAAGLNILGGAVLTFTASDWAAKTITIGVPPNTPTTSPLTVTTSLTTTETTSGEGYEGETVSDVTVTVTAASSG